MSKAALMQAIQEMMDAQFKAGFMAGKLNEIVNSLHPDSTDKAKTEEESQPE